MADDFETDIKFTKRGKAKEVGMVEEYDAASEKKQNGKEEFKISDIIFKKAKINFENSKLGLEKINGLKNPFKKIEAFRKYRIAKREVKIAKQEKTNAKSIMKLLAEKFKNLVEQIKEKYKQGRKNKKERVKQEIKRYCSTI